MKSGNQQESQCARLSRRKAVQVAGASTLLAAYGSSVRPVSGQEATPEEASPAIVIPDTGAELPEGKVTFKVLVQGPGPRSPFYPAFFDAYHEAHSQIKIEFNELPGEQIQQILPIAVQDGEAADLFQLAGSLTTSEAVTAGWIAPLEDIIPNFENWKARFPDGSFPQGISVFDGKTYSFPLHSNKRYDTMLYYNAAYMEQAGYDPSSTPMTWDEFRQAARNITEQGNGQYFGLALGAAPAALEPLINNWGTTAGAAGGETLGGNMNWATGEYNYTTDEYLAAIDFLLALQNDGSIFPGYLSLSAREAEPNVTQGTAGMVLDGVWLVARWQQRAPEFSYGIGSLPIQSNDSFTPMGYGPGGLNGHFVGANSKLKSIGGDIFAYWGSPEGQTAFQAIVGGALIAYFPEAQDAVELDPHSAKTRELFDKQLKLHPDPRVRNPDIAKVYLEFKRLQPNFGAVIQGLLSGQLDDPKAAMQDLKDRADAELERAIETVNGQGASVSRDDWVFANWDPNRDYTDADYDALKG